MGIAVRDITATSATVTWPPSPGCAGGFYSVLYHPNWNGLLLGYARGGLLREAVVPPGRTSASLVNLSPQTAYVLCVACRSARPGGEQCQAFHTLEEGGPGPGGGQGAGAGRLAGQHRAAAAHRRRPAVRLPPLLVRPAADTAQPPHGCGGKEPAGHPYSPSSPEGDPQPDTPGESPCGLAGSASVSDPGQESVALAVRPASEGTP